MNKLNLCGAALVILLGTSCGNNRTTNNTTADTTLGTPVAPPADGTDMSNNGTDSLRNNNNAPGDTIAP